MKRAVNTGQVEQVVSSADCRSAEHPADPDGRVSEEKVVSGATGIAPADRRSAGQPQDIDARIADLEEACQAFSDDADRLSAELARVEAERDAMTTVAAAQERALKGDGDGSTVLEGVLRETQAERDALRGALSELTKELPDLIGNRLASASSTTEGGEK